MSAPFGRLMILLLTAGCQEAPVEAPLTALAPRQQLIRLSVDLRGIHPSEEELLAIDESPALYDDYVDRWLTDPRFSVRLREVWNQRFLTRTGDSYFELAEAGITTLSEVEVATALADEPLRLVSYLAENELPYSDIVLADYTMADAVVAAMWDLESVEGEKITTVGDWQPAHYRDGRPEAGILTMSTIWQRYPSMGGNANRHRANAVSKMLLCDDYLSRPIVLNRAAVDQLTEDPEDAINSNETCQSCHSTLDPLAAHFFGFFHYDSLDGLRDATEYRPENEEGWRLYSGRSPAYYGRPTANIVELAEAIAADPAFVDCAVRTAWEGFTQRSLDLDADWAEYEAHRAAFVAADLNLRALVGDIVRSDAYKASAATDPDLDLRLAGVRTASPAQLASIVADITGYQWTFSGSEGLVEDVEGLVVLGGGIDSSYVRDRAYPPSVGTAFVVERLAQSAGGHVAAHDLDPDRSDAAILLDLVGAGDTPETAPEAFDAQVRALYLAITGIPLAADATEPELLATMWKQVYAVEGSGEAAWAAVVAAVIRDPQVIFY
jgi:Protein of unknown function (DUF1588)